MQFNHKTKRRDLDFIMRDLNYYSVFPGKQFAETLNRNREVTLKMIEATNVLANTTKPKEFDQFKQEESVILNKYAVRDEQGRVQTAENGGVAISQEKQVEFEAEIAALQTKFEPFKESFNAFFQDYKNVLDEETEISLEYLSKEELHDSINANQLDKFMIGPDYLRKTENII